MKAFHAGVLCVCFWLLGGLIGAQAGSCALSVSDSGSTLTVGMPGTITTVLSNPPDGDTRTVGVKFEIINGDADFDGTPSPVFLPVPLSGSTSSPAEVDISLVARAAGDIQVRVTWLDAPDGGAAPLSCASMPVMPHSFDLMFTAEAGARTLTLAVAGGEGQQIGIGEDSMPLVFQIESDDGSDVSGLTLEFSTEPKGALLPSVTSAVTNANGEAELTVRGLEAGDAFVDAILQGPEGANVAPAKAHVTVLGAAGSFNLEIIDGDGQQLELNQPSDPLVVMATDAKGQPLSGLTVEWRVEPAGVATLESQSTITSTSGETQNSVRALQEGDFNVVAVLLDANGNETAGLVEFALSAGNNAGGLNLDLVDGDDQELELNEPSDPLIVEASNTDGDPLSGKMIEWRVEPPSAAVLDSTSTLTGADGESENRVRALQQGDFEVVARLIDPNADPEFTTVRFSLSAGAGGEISLEIVDGDEQELEVNEASEPLVVAALDADDEPLSGRIVQWRVEPPGAAVLDTAGSLTGPDGETQNIVRALRPGDFEVVAQLQGVAPEDVDATTVRFSLTAGEAEEGANLEIVEGDDQDLELNEPSDPLIVAAFNDDDEPLAGETVEWRIDPPNAAILDSPRTLTDSNGKAQNRVRALREGDFEVVAMLVGVDPEDLETSTVRFSLSAEDELAGASLQLFAGNNQSLAVNTVSDPLVVAAKDAAGNGLANAGVSWRVDPPTAGTLDVPSNTTDAAGKAQNRVRAAQAGNFVVVAQLAGAGPGDPMTTVRFNIGFESVPAGSTLRVVSGDDQGLVPGSPSAPLVVELRNGQGQPIAGARLRFSGSPAGAASFDPPEAVTGADGRASTRVVPQLPGALTITVTVVGDPSITTSFTLRGGTSFIQGLNNNQQGVASAIDAACPGLAGGPPPPAGGAGADLLARCSEIVAAANGRPADVQAALNQLLPDEAAPQATASLNVRDSQLRNLDVRLDALRSGARRNSLAGLTLNTNSGALPLDLLTQLAQGLQDEDPETEIESGGLISPWGAFLTGTISRVDRDSTNNNPGFDGDSMSLTAGVDYRFNYSFVGGLALGYDDSSVDLVQDSGSIDTRSLTFSIYSSYATANDFYIDARAAYGQLEFDLERNIRYRLGANPIDITASASPEGSSRLLAISLGRNFNRNRWNFGGYLRGELSRIELDGYSETVAANARDGRGLVVRIDARELDSRTATAGMRLSYTSSRDWGVLLPFGRLEWVHEFENDPQTTVARFINDPTGTPIFITGDEQDDGYGNVSIGLTGIFANGRSAFLQYERRFAQEAIDRDSFTIGGRFEF